MCSFVLNIKLIKWKKKKRMQFSLKLQIILNVKQRQLTLLHHNYTENTCLVMKKSGRGCKGKKEK